MKERYIVYYKYNKQGKLHFKFFYNFQNAYDFYKKSYLDFYDTHITYIVKIV